MICIGFCQAVWGAWSNWGIAGFGEVYFFLWNSSSWKWGFHILLSQASLLIFWVLFQEWDWFGVPGKHSVVLCIKVVTSKKIVWLYVVSRMWYLIENVPDFDSMMGLLSLIYIPNDLIFFRLIFCAMFEILFCFLVSFARISLAFAIIHHLWALKKKQIHSL